MLNPGILAWHHEKRNELQVRMFLSGFVKPDARLLFFFFLCVVLFCFVSKTQVGEDRRTELWRVALVHPLWGWIQISGPKPAFLLWRVVRCTLMPMCNIGWMHSGSFSIPLYSKESYVPPNQVHYNLVTLWRKQIQNTLNVLKNPF